MSVGRPFTQRFLDEGFRLWHALSWLCEVPAAVGVRPPQGALVRRGTEWGSTSSFQTNPFIIYPLAGSSAPSRTPHGFPNV